VPEGNRVGDVLASKYRLEELLGSGGMGHVYRAVNVEIERAVAIKVLRSEHATNAPLVERFLREARAANLVRHPNVVDVVDIGRDVDGSPFIVQELLEGEDLSKFVARRGGKLTIDEVQELLLPVVDAVAEAHEHGVVHRDIKPENVFLAYQGKRRIPKLLDFGISKVRVANIKLTEVGVMMGTPAYMAPEQIQGARDADPRSDVWALGIMLFELLSGRLPFDAEDAPSLFYAVATKDVPRLSDVCADVTPNVSTIVERCLRRSPEDRYPSALELARDLRLVFQGGDVEATHAYAAPSTGGAPPPLALHQTELALAPATFTDRADAIELSDSLPRSPPASHRIATAAAAGRRAPAGTFVPDARAASKTGSDATLLIGLAVVGLTSIVATAVLMTFAYRPEGWPVVGFATKPTPTINLVVQSGLALLTCAVGVRSAAGGLKKWRGDFPGGRGAAVGSALVAGALFFAALQLARAAW
jgi:serine/threonine-protein kinase